MTENTEHGLKTFVILACRRIDITYFKLFTKHVQIPSLVFRQAQHDKSGLQVVWK